MGRDRREILDVVLERASIRSKSGRAHPDDVHRLVGGPLRRRATVAVHDRQHVGEPLIAVLIGQRVTDSDIHQTCIDVVSQRGRGRSPAVVGGAGTVAAGIPHQAKHPVGLGEDGVVQLFEHAGPGRRTLAGQELPRINDAARGITHHGSGAQCAVTGLGGGVAAAFPDAVRDSADQIGCLLGHPGVDAGQRDPRAGEAHGGQPLVVSRHEIAVLVQTGVQLIGEFAPVAAVPGHGLHAVDARNRGDLLEHASADGAAEHFEFRIHAAPLHGADFQIVQGAHHTTDIRTAVDHDADFEFGLTAPAQVGQQSARRGEISAPPDGGQPLHGPHLFRIRPGDVRVGMDVLNQFDAALPQLDAIHIANRIAELDQTQIGLGVRRLGQPRGEDRTGVQRIEGDPSQPEDLAR